MKKECIWCNKYYSVQKRGIYLCSNCYNAYKEGKYACDLTLNLRKIKKSWFLSLCIKVCLPLDFKVWQEIFYYT